MKYLLSLSLLITSFSVFADNLNNRQRRMSAIYLSQTDIGESTLSQQSLKHQFFDKYQFGDIQPKLTSIYSFNAQDGEINTFTVNGLLLGASPIYLSWTLAYTLKHYEMYEVAKSYSFDPNLNFLEKEILAFATAAIHWKQLGSPNNEDFINPINDKPEDIRNHIKASAKKYDNALKQGPEKFKDLVKSRFYKFSKTKYTASELLQSDKLTDGQKQYIIYVMEELEAILKLY